MTKKREGRDGGPDWIERATEIGAIPWRAAPWTERRMPTVPPARGSIPPSRGPGGPGSVPPSRRSLPPNSQSSRPSLRAVPGSSASIPAIAPDLARAQMDLASAQATISSLEDALAHAHAEAEALREALAAQSREIAERRAAEAQDIEDSLVTVALAIARRVVARELATDPALVVAWVRETIHAAKMGRDATIAIAPGVAAKIPDAAWGELAARVTTDARLAADACEIRDGARTVTTSADARSEAIAQHVAATTSSAPPPAQDDEKRAA